MTNPDPSLPPPWMTDAACAGMDPNVFHPPGALAAINAAFATRARCPVRAECLEHAITHREDHGIWGGMTARQRLRIARRRSLEVP